MNDFNFKLEPGKIEENRIKYIEHEPVIYVIIPSYNSQEYIEQVYFVFIMCSYGRIFVPATTVDASFKST